jgi:hypothetical protein
MKPKWSLRYTIGPAETQNGKVYQCVRLRPMYVKFLHCFIWFKVIFAKIKYWIRFRKEE